MDAGKVIFFMIITLASLWQCMAIAFLYYVRLHQLSYSFVRNVQ